MKDKTNIKVLIEGEYIPLECIETEFKGFKKLEYLMLINAFNVRYIYTGLLRTKRIVLCLKGTYNGNYFSQEVRVIQKPKNIKDAVNVFLKYGEFEEIVKSFDILKKF